MTKVTDKMVLAALDAAYPRKHAWTVPPSNHRPDYEIFTSMRDVVQAAMDVTSPPDDKDQSERWMRAWALRHVAYDYYGDHDGKNSMRSEDDAFAFAIRIGEDHFVGPYEDARDYIDETWWTHWENITGKTGERGVYFSCGC